MGGKRWSEDEDIYLEYFVYNPDGARIKDASKFLGRTYGAVCTRLNELRKRTESVGYINKKWSKQEDDYLRANYQLYSAKELSAVLGRGVEGVKSRKSFLKLSSVTPITIHKEKIIALVEQGYYRKDIANELKIDVKSLSTFLRINKIFCKEVPYSERTKKMKEIVHAKISIKKRVNQ